MRHEEGTAEGSAEQFTFCVQNTAGIEHVDESVSVVSVELCGLGPRRDSCRQRHRYRSTEPLVKFFEGQFTLQPVTFFAVANFTFQWREKIKRDVRGLEVLGIRVRNI